jgi:hypothetical protein
MRGSTLRRITSRGGGEHRDLDPPFPSIVHSAELPENAHMTYKVAFLNPWRNASENQAYQSLRVAADRLGCTLIGCSNSMEVEACDPDYVLAVASTQPKLTRHPTFGVIHEPRERFLLNREYFNNLLTYDGYFTIMDTLQGFLQHVLAGIGRECEIGFYFDAPQRLDLRAPVEALAGEGALKLTYFGTNWDSRQRELFIRLEREGLIDVYGPPAAWAYLTGGSYRGALPFDGEAPQRAYAANGAGLVLLSEEHLRDDVISNRVFEIASGGAVGVACDTPWLRRHFGDSLYYFDQRTSAARMAERLREILGEIRAAPAVAAARAREAQRIFEQRFSAEVLFKNTIDYFERWKGARTWPDRRTHPSVSVVVRCGGRPLATVRRALQSLRDQTFGRVTAILVPWGELDVAELQKMTGDALVEVRVIACPGGSRSATLSAGLQAVDTAYFGIVDDDDAWFPTHLERVFEVFRRDPEARLVLSGSIREDKESFPIMGGGQERRRIDRFGPFGQAGDIWDILGAFAPNAFIGEAALLDARLTADPRMITAEDSALELGLIGRSRPRFTYGATAVQYHSDDASRFLVDPGRHEDELTSFIRRMGELDVLIGPEATRYLLGTTLVRALSSKDHLVRRVGERVIFGAYSIDYATGAPGPGAGAPVVLTAERVELSGPSRLFEEGGGTPAAARVEVRPPELPWNWGAAIDLGLRGVLGHDGILIVRGRVTTGLMGFTLFDDSGRQPLFRRVLAADGGAFELHVPIIKGSRIGKFVAHNWADGGRCAAVLESLSILWLGAGSPPPEPRGRAPQVSRRLKRVLRRALRAGVTWIRTD